MSDPSNTTPTPAGHTPSWADQCSSDEEVSLSTGNLVRVTDVDASGSLYEDESSATLTAGRLAQVPEEFAPVLPLRKKKKKAAAAGAAGWKKMASLESDAVRRRKEWGTTKNTSTGNDAIKANDGSKDSNNAAEDTDAGTNPITVAAIDSSSLAPEPLTPAAATASPMSGDTPAAADAGACQGNGQNNCDEEIADEEIAAALSVEVSAASEEAPVSDEAPAPEADAVVAGTDSDTPEADAVPAKKTVVNHEEDALWAAYQAQAKARAAREAEEAEAAAEEKGPAPSEAEAEAEEAGGARSRTPSSVSSEYASTRPSRDGEDDEDRTDADDAVDAEGKAGDDDDAAATAAAKATPSSPKNGTTAPVSGSPAGLVSAPASAAPAPEVASAPSVPSYASAAAKATVKKVVTVAAPVPSAEAAASKESRRRQEKAERHQQQLQKRRQKQEQRQQQQQQQRAGKLRSAARSSRGSVEAWVVTNADEASYSSDEESTLARGAGRSGGSRHRGAGARASEMSWSVQMRDEASSWSTELGGAADCGESSWSSTAGGSKLGGDDESSWSVASKGALARDRAAELAQGRNALNVAPGADADMSASASVSVSTSKLSQDEQIARRRLKRKQHAARKLAAMAAEEEADARRSGRSGKGVAATKAAAAAAAAEAAAATKAAARAARADSGPSMSTIRLVAIVAATALATVGVLYATGALSGSGRAKSFALGEGSGSGASNVYIIDGSHAGSCLNLPEESMRAAERIQELSYEEIVVFYDTDGDGSMSVEEMANAVFPSVREPTVDVVNVATQLLLFVNSRARNGNTASRGSDGSIAGLRPCPTGHAAAPRRLSNVEAARVLGIDQLNTVVPRSAAEESAWDESLKANNLNLWNTMQSSFAFYDQNTDRRIDSDELTAVLRMFDTDMTPEAMKESFANADKNSNGFVEFSEFVRMVNNDDVAAAAQ